MFMSSPLYAAPNVLSTKVSLQSQQAPMSEIILKLSEQAKANFVIHNDDVDINRPLSLNVKNKKLSAVLNQLAQSTDSAWKINSRGYIEFVAKKRLWLPIDLILQKLLALLMIF